MSLQFWKCLRCGNVAVKLYDRKAPLVCCGEKMVELTANTEDGAREKHVPAVTVDGAKVEVVVGSVEHPMEEDHFITMIVLETEKGFQVAQLAPGQAPRATFAVAEGDKAVAAYEYCNKHGLWKAEI